MRRKGWRIVTMSADISGPNALKATHVTAKGKLNVNETAETVTLMARSSEEEEFDADEL